MPISEGVEAKKAKVYVDKDGGTYVQIFPEIYCESEIKPDSLYPVSSSALSQWKATIETNTAPFSGATGTSNGASGTVPMAKPEDRNSFLRGDGKWTAVEITDNKVKNTASAYTRFYLAGSAQQATNTGMQYFDPNVYVSERAGELVAPKIIGNLTGNVTGDLYGNASYATADANGETIHTTYATKAEMAQRSLIGHQHSISDMISLTGYVKGTSAQAISQTDSLTTALGKIEVRLDNSATMDSPALSGVPTAPTPDSNSSANQVANKEYVDTSISNLVNGAGTALDTLGELAAALGNNPNFAASVTTEIGKKVTTGSAGYVKKLSITNATGGQNLIVQFGNDSTDTLFVKDTVVSPATAEPKPHGTAKVGTSVRYAREDHIHPMQTVMNGKITAIPEGTTWVAGATSGKALVNATTTGFGALLNAPTKNYRVAVSTYPSSNDLVYLYSVTNANVSSGTNTTNKSLTWNAATGELAATSFTGTLNGAATSCSGNAATASKLGTSTVGGTAKPIYLNGGSPAAISATAGSASKPVWLNGGTITACSSTIGSTTKPVYMNAGTITASNATVGSATKPVYLNGGTITACSNVSGNPTGAIIWYGGTSAPSGYLVCNGQAVSRTTYADLYKVIGTRFGAGNGSSTFNVPNIVNRFIEGATSGIGGTLDAGLPNITGRTCRVFGGNWSTYPSSGAFRASRTLDRCYKIANDNQNGWVNLNFNAANSNGIYGRSSTVQPPAIKLLPCIKT